VVYKVVKHFRSYILKNHTKVIVPHPVVRSLYTQQELGERRGNWMTFIQEFDLEIKPSHIVKGQGLCRLVVESQDVVLKEKKDGKMSSLICSMITFIPPPHGSWYSRYDLFLHHGVCPNHMTSRERRDVKVKIFSI
jgi:hypothetical protein